MYVYMCVCMYVQLDLIRRRHNKALETKTMGIIYWAAKAEAARMRAEAARQAGASCCRARVARAHWDWAMCACRVHVALLAQRAYMEDARQVHLQKKKRKEAGSAMSGRSSRGSRRWVRAEDAGGGLRSASRGALATMSRVLTFRSG